MMKVCLVWFIVLNATFNNISVLSLRYFVYCRISLLEIELKPSIGANDQKRIKIDREYITKKYKLKNLQMN